MNGRIIVIGGGHAGCEAALAASRMGIETVLYAINLDGIAMMPCNPCIGGSAKGHLVREIDALGGQMGKTIDAAYLQSRMLNRSKGPAVYSLRAQADKRRYMAEMKRALEAEPNLTVKQGEAMEIIAEGSAAEDVRSDGNFPVSAPPPAGDGGAKGKMRVVGIRTESGAVIPCDAVIVCAGTYMEARCLYGETVSHTGPNGQKASHGLSECLKRLGFNIMRFKTGTPARVHRRSIDFSKMEPQHGDKELTPFSFETDPSTIVREQIPCHLTYTTLKTHEIIRSQAHRSPMFNGLIEGTGTRYCPSIEDKVVRFADKERHPVFIEPEGEDTEEMYVQGMSSSLPEDVQIAAYRSVPGLERCEIMRNAYAIEYDCIDATQLRLTLEAKHVRGLYTAGQVNGSSGYEEAAAQGLVAGINAALSLGNKQPLVIDRSEGYIGVLIDDLVTKGTAEPYRMMTSRAEYRLLLRQDNADLRLTEKGYAAGLIPQKRYETFCAKRELILRETGRVKKVNVAPGREVNALLKEAGSTEISTGCKLSELIKRPELSYGLLKPADPARPARPDDCPGYIWPAVTEQVNIQVKYEGYIALQLAQAEAFKKLERKTLPADLDYLAISGLRLEARQKLDKLRPANVGQASRITGVSPADMNVLLVLLKNR